MVNLDSIWDVLIEVRDKTTENGINLGNHLTDHKIANSKQFKVIIMLGTLLGIALIAYFTK